MSAERQLEAAERIGAQLCRDAFWSGDRCNWFGWSLVTTRQGHVPAYRSLEFTLDEGLAGIVLFLAELQARRPDPIVADTLRGAARQVVHLVESTPLRAGFHAGHAGAAYALLRVAAILSDPELQLRSLKWLDLIADHDFRGSRPDVYAGTAGTALVLAVVGAALRRRAPLKSALGHAKILAATAQRGDAGCCWPLAQGAPARKGFALGASGIAVALAEISRAAGEPEGSDLIHEALRWEGAVSAPDSNASSAAAPPPDPFPLSWLRGVAGMAQARLRLLDFFPQNEAWKRECQLLLNSLAEGVSQSAPNFSISEGFAGIGDCLLMARSRQFNDAAISGALSWMFELGWQRHIQSGHLWPLGAPGTGESPSLMRGLAGIGLFHLRLADPDGVESPLIPGALKLSELAPSTPPLPL
jgi:lantibiotic modifying enzyme